MLIAINLVVFVILAFIKVVYFFSEGDQGMIVFRQGFVNWVTLPADWHTFLSRPWTLLSHMFVHDTQGVWHILGNLLWLWAFGYILQDLTGNRKIIPIFIYGALAGAIAYMLAFNFIPPLAAQLTTETRAMGASAGIMAIAIGVTTLAPGYRIFTMLNGGIPIWILTVIYLVLDLAMIPESNAGGHIAHLAGGLMGFLFMVSMRRGTDLGK
jgi:membrane associated rhomboid family serine protease